MDEIFHANGNSKKAGVAIFIAVKTDFKQRLQWNTKTIHNDKGINPASIYNIYKYILPNTRAPGYRKEVLMDIKGESDSNIVIARDFNTPFTPVDRSSRQNISKRTRTSNNILDHMDLIDTRKTFHQKAAEYAFFSSTNGTFSRTDQRLATEKFSLNSRLNS